MDPKKLTLAAAGAAALLAAAPGVQAVAAQPAAVETSASQPCILDGLIAAAAVGASLPDIPVAPSICSKPRSEPGWFFCQGFTLYRR
ncbi:MAG: hypothetical protein ACLFQ5_03590 [Oceanicaulis sp.]